MPTKDRLLEFKKQPTNIADDAENHPSTSNGQCEDMHDVDNNHHLIGSGGRLADFFDNVEKISSSIDKVKKSVADVDCKQREILSKPGNQKLQEQLEELQSDIKETINGKIRSKVIFSTVSFYICHHIFCNKQQWGR